MKKNKGFTLIELLISIAILSILTIAFSKISISAINGNSKNSTDIVAINIAQSEIENIRSQMKLYKSSSSISLNSEGKELLIPLTSVCGQKLKYGVNECYLKSGNNEYKVLIEIEEVVIDELTYKQLYEVKVRVALKEEKKYISKKETELVTHIRLDKI